MISDLGGGDPGLYSTTLRTLTAALGPCLLRPSTVYTVAAANISHEADSTVTTRGTEERTGEAEDRDFLRADVDLAERREGRQGALRRERQMGEQLVHS